MENQDLNFKILRVSNRGTNVHETVTNQQYRINIPSELRIPNKIIKVDLAIVGDVNEVLKSVIKRINKRRS